MGVKGEGMERDVGEVEGHSQLTSLSTYIRDVREYELLTKEEEIELAKRIEVGEDEAKNELIIRNLRLVINAAKRYRGNGVAYEDLIQEGNIGLMRAVDKYDYRTGNRFSTYAVWWIRNRLQYAILQYGRSIRIPKHTVDIVRRVERERIKLIQERGKEVTQEELAEHMGLDSTEINFYTELRKDVDTLDRPVGNDPGDVLLMHYIPDTKEKMPEDVAVEKDLKEKIVGILSQFSERERYIIHRRFGLGNTPVYTLKEIGEDLGLSRERVRQIEGIVIRKMRDPRVSGDLKDLYKPE